MISFPPKFLLKIVKAVRSLEEGVGIMSIIIQQPYAHLEKELSKTFKGQKDVQVIVNRRYGERRKRPKYVAIDCRKADQRRTKVVYSSVLLIKS